MDRFLRIIAYISAFYTNFKFQLKDDEGNASMQLEVWYDVFRDFNEEQLVEVIKMYCKENTYPPSSPAQILEYMRVKIENHSTSGEQAFEVVVEMIRRFAYDLERVEKEFNETNRKVLAITVKEMRSDFLSWFKDGTQLNWLKKNFVTVYNEKLKIDISKRVSVGQIASDNKLLLE